MARSFSVGAVAIIFVLTSATAWAQVTVVHSFGPSDTKYPFWPMLRGTDGSLYGVTASGGSADLGTVFRMDSAGSVTVVHSFSGADGRNPRSLIQASDGFFYGVTGQGGVSDSGTIFRTDLTGSVTVLHSFPAGGGAPSGSLIQASDGFLYGATSLGGASGVGTIFRMDLTGAVTVLHSFDDSITGRYPNAGVIQMDSARTVTVLHSFGAGEPAGPLGGLIQAVDGLFYGVSLYGGAYGFGTIFQMDSWGVTTLLHSFDGPATGSDPYGPLIQLSDGRFFGTATLGGAFGQGVVFEMDAIGAVTVLHSFTGTPDGGIVGAGLIQGVDEDLYGVTQNGGASDLGTIFKVSTAPLLLAASIQPPINSDGSSVFPSRRGVVAVRFTLASGGESTCTLPPATIELTRLSGGTIGPINESAFATAADSGSNFRTSGCQYIYNLGTSSLGTGTYRIDVKISGAVVGSASFGLR